MSCQPRSVRVIAITIDDIMFMIQFLYRQTYSPSYKPRHISIMDTIYSLIRLDYSIRDGINPGVRKFNWDKHRWEW